MIAVELIPDPEQGGFTARIPDVPAYGEGRTEDAAIADLKEALRGYIETFGLEETLLGAQVSAHVRSGPPAHVKLPSAQPTTELPSSPKEVLPMKRPRRLPGKKKSPLYDRIFYKPHYVEIVRCIGSDGRGLSEVQEMLRLLGAKFSQETLKEAADEILDIDNSQNPPFVRLTDEARKLAGSILAHAAQVNPAPASSTARTSTSPA